MSGDRVLRNAGCMVKALNVCFIVLASFASFACLNADSDGRRTQIVDGLERKWLQAQRENTTAPLDDLLADQFVDTGSDGTVRNKAETIEGQKTVKFISVEYADTKMNVYGNTVIVTGVMNAEAINLASGHNFEIHERNTDTWVRMPNGQWQCVATQQTTVGK